LTVGRDLVQGQHLAFRAAREMTHLQQSRDKQSSRRYAQSSSGEFRRNCCVIAKHRTGSYSKGHDMGAAAAIIYKLCGAAEWAEAASAGAYTGSADDRRDGFIHFSTAVQLAETARRYFSGRPDLVLVAFDAASLGERLKWEASRGGDLFPHLYAELPTTRALWVLKIDLDAAGVPIIPEGVA
jgi:uncharacterized protein (DUF952 family)